MNIKTRILLSAVALQLIGFAVLIYRNNAHISDTVLDDSHRQFLQSVDMAVKHFNDASDVMERMAAGLARSGELLHQQRQLLNRSVLENQSRQLLLRTFDDFDQAIGGGIWFEPFALKPTLRYFGPYVFHASDGLTFSWELSNADYDYHQQDWYQLALPPGWDRSLRRHAPFYWTPPYVDQAGSEALMMTVDALMYDANQRLIGMSTVDWALGHARDYVQQLAPTPNSHSFMFHPASQMSVLDQGNAEFTPLGQLSDWQQSLMAIETGSFHQLVLPQTGNEYFIYAGKTDTGFVLGFAVPKADLIATTQSYTAHTLPISALIAALFAAAMLLILRLLFGPFDTILTLLRSTVASNQSGNDVPVQPIRYQGNNEFSAIISTFNTLVKQVQEYSQQVATSNAALLEQQRTVEELNSSLEQKVTQRTEELQQKSSEALESLRQLKLTQNQLVHMEKHAALGDMVAGLAHEINTPLGIGVTAVSALEDYLEELNSQYQSDQLSKTQLRDFISFAEESIDITGDNLRRAADMIGRFKQVAVDQASEQRRDFEVGDYLQSIASSLRPNYKYRPIDVRFEVAERIIVSSYPGALAQVITNLMMNSLTHAFDPDQNGTILLRAERQDDKLIIHYSDDGKGMDAEVLEHLYEPFFTTRKGKGGSGLGAHIIHNLVTGQLHGTIEVTSAPEQGCHFTLTLPCNPPSAGV
ncbi:hypothetical protein CHH28_18440 [Bacterioplanes sanyensis]|uniref:histidine kinase n=1 Tax=Bacterioplanes sanyensis TaxID=1249553 RepID=A0A222FPS9_9GAMM|nr:ATP-binding protein [Bacterioplanes sanyensis]ASP40524.1 hypothetical protein CHH28_18440 [Bacterioplanes sanyensis]